MAYTHADGRIIQKARGRFRALAATAVMAGDLVYMAGSTGVLLATNVTTGGAFTKDAWAVACENIASGSEGWCALAVEIKDPDTISTTGGAVTIGAIATTADIMSPLYLSATAGEATSTAPTASSSVIKQYVGYILSVDRIILAPTNFLTVAASA